MRENLENRIKIKISVNEKFDSLYKLGYFLVDLNSICNFAIKINKQDYESAKKIKKYSYGITSRYLNKNSLDIIQLEEFSQGSLLSNIVAPVIVGVILLIAGKYINQGLNQNKVEITINDIQINNIINFHFDNKLTLDENTNKILSELINEKLLTEYGIYYDEDGKKILFHNIERLKKQINNGNW